MKKRKTLTKKIERLKARLEKDTLKLARLIGKLGARTASKKKPAGAPTRAEKSGTSKKRSASSKRSTARSKRRSLSETAPKTTPPRKKKLNLTPERRAQLSAAMKARWEAKRSQEAQPAANPEGSSE